MLSYFFSVSFTKLVLHFLVVCNAICASAACSKTSYLNYDNSSTLTSPADLREILVRMEDTIVFALIERSQFPASPNVYQINRYDLGGFDGSLMQWYRLQIERSDSQLGLFEAPDETPFFPGQLLPSLLAPIIYPKVLTNYGSAERFNKEIEPYYVREIVPQIACTNEDQKYNLASVAASDTAVLKALSRRVHLGNFVAEAKYQGNPEFYNKLIMEKDVQGIDASITNKTIEDQVVRRVKEKGAEYGTDPSFKYPRTAEQVKVNPELIAGMYRDFVIPLTKKVEIEYLLHRLDVAK